jgi:hypothetical protein
MPGSYLCGHEPTPRYKLAPELWGEDGDELVSRGHHPPLPFLLAGERLMRSEAQVSYSLGHSTLKDAVISGRLRLDVRHEWRRVLPPGRPTGSEWDDLRYTQIVEGPGRGVFPVTVVYL